MQKANRSLAKFVKVREMANAAIISCLTIYLYLESRDYHMTLLHLPFISSQHAFNFMDRGVVFRLVARYMEAFSYKENPVG